jgi:hypothetical protein
LLHEDLILNNLAAIYHEGEGELELVYNNRESINNDAEKGIFIVISLAPGIPLRICVKRGKIQALCFQTFKPQEKCTVKLNPVK